MDKEKDGQRIDKDGKECGKELMLVEIEKEHDLITKY
jgi:hypothetical protein